MESRLYKIRYMYQQEKFLEHKWPKISSKKDHFRMKIYFLNFLFWYWYSHLICSLPLYQTYKKLFEDLLSSWNCAKCAKCQMIYCKCQFRQVKSSPFPCVIANKILNIICSFEYRTTYEQFKRKSEGHACFYKIYLQDQTVYSQCLITFPISQAPSFTKFLSKILHTRP